MPISGAASSSALKLGGSPPDFIKGRDSAPGLVNSVHEQGLHPRGDGLAPEIREPLFPRDQRAQFLAQDKQLEEPGASLIARHFAGRAAASDEEFGARRGEQFGGGVAVL